MNIEEIAKALGKPIRQSNGWSCCCPVHEDRSPSLSIRIGDNGDLVVHCFAGCKWEQIKDFLYKEKLVGRLTRICSDSHKVIPIVQPSPRALELWQSSICPIDTPAEAYLQRRGYTGVIPDTLRYHEWTYHKSGAEFPALIGAITIYPSPKIYAVHRIYLKPDGSKADVDPQKAFLGPVKKGACRLAPYGETLAICEGIETGLSVMQNTGFPVWAALSADGLECIEVPRDSKYIKIFADNDPHNRGLEAAKKCAFRLRALGHAVEIRIPYHVKDYNDYYHFPLEKLTESQRENFEERAAIREYDGKMSRKEAEREALNDIFTNVA